jgi:hypothetical protein
MRKNLPAGRQVIVSSGWMETEPRLLQETNRKKIITIKNKI